MDRRLNRSLSMLTLALCFSGLKYAYPVLRIKKKKSERFYRYISWAKPSCPTPPEAQYSASKHSSDQTHPAH